jgi:hypothetical protein
VKVKLSPVDSTTERRFDGWTRRNFPGDRVRSSMRLPLPKNRIVALTLVGALLTLVVAGALATPGVLPTPDEKSAPPRADAPTPNDSFTPAVSDGGASDGDDDEYEEHEHEAEDEYEEHDDLGAVVLP